MRITQEADYAIRVVVFLYSKETLADAKTISAEIKVPIRYTLKILRKLVQSGIIKSFKGIHGGYRLPPNSGTPTAGSKLSLARIIEAIDGPIRVTRCFSDEFECSKNGLNKQQCLIHNKFAEVNELIYNKFDECLIEELI